MHVSVEVASPSFETPRSLDSVGKCVCTRSSSNEQSALIAFSNLQVRYAPSPSPRPKVILYLVRLRCRASDSGLESW